MIRCHSGGPIAHDLGKPFEEPLVRHRLFISHCRRILSDARSPKGLPGCHQRFTGQHRHGPGAFLLVKRSRLTPKRSYFRHRASQEGHTNVPSTTTRGKPTNAAWEQALVPTRIRTDKLLRSETPSETYMSLPTREAWIQRLGGRCRLGSGGNKINQRVIIGGDTGGTLRPLTLKVSNSLCFVTG